MFALLVAEKALQQYRGTPFERPLVSAFKKMAAGLPDNLAQTLTSNNFVPQFRGFDIFEPAVVGPTQIQQAGIDINQRTSYSLQWSFNVKRELTHKVTLEVG